MLTEFTQWLFNLVKQGFDSAWQFVQDAFIAFFGLIIDGFVWLASSIPVPDFMSGGLSSVWGGLDPGVMYVVTQCGVPAALAVIGAGYAFRVLRKLVTLFQW